nr:Na+/H+ antiporter NhaC family protein [Bacillota bacterium]
ALVQDVEGYREEESVRSTPWAFLIPLAIMIAATLLTGTDVLMGALFGVVSAFILYALQKRLRIKELLTCCYDGVISMGFVLILCVLAFAVQAANGDLLLAEYVISVTEPIMKGAFLPAAVFLVCAVYAYATGCFWDLAAIIMPIVVPLAAAMDVNVLLASAAVFSGAAFGSNTCLYGDGVILCSQGCQIRPGELMMATLPYALISGGASFILYIIAGFLM